MKAAIKWTRVAYCDQPIWRTPRFGNLLADSVQGEVNQDASDGTWSAWMFRLSGSGRGELKLGMISKLAAVRQVNRWLRAAGVKG